MKSATNHFDDVDLSTPHAKPSADAETAKSNKLFKDTNKYADDITTNGGTHKYDLETNPVRNYDINTTKNYVNKSSQVDILKSNSHIDDIDWNDSNTRFNMPATETAGCVDDLYSPKATSSMRDNFSFAEGSNSNDKLNFMDKDGRLSIEDIKANPNIFSGKSADEIAQVLIDSGYDVTIKKSAKSKSGAQIIKINNPGGNKNITQVQVSPGGGRHGESPYVKISTRDLGKIKIIDGSKKTYKTDGKENATIFFTGGK